MKKRIIILPMLLLTISLVCVAQNRVKTHKKGTPVTTSIPLTGPAIVDNHLAFLGISLNESATMVKTKLVSKGMKIARNEEGSNNIYLTGAIDGVNSKVMLGVTAENKIYSLHVYDVKVYRLPQAKTRFGNLLAKVESIYGKGTYETNEADYKKYIIKTAKGKVVIDLFNEDEMDGASEFYCVAFGLSENW